MTLWSYAIDSSGKAHRLTRKTSSNASNTESESIPEDVPACAPNCALLAEVIVELEDRKPIAFSHVKLYPTAFGMKASGTPLPELDPVEVGFWLAHDAMKRRLSPDAAAALGTAAAEEVERLRDTQQVFRTTLETLCEVANHVFP